MLDTYLSISYDLDDKKFLQLKQEFTDHMKEMFTCDDYDSIIDYILKCVFDNKQSKDRMINETKDMFKDKTEALYDFLWDITDKIYQLPKVDLLDEIVKEKEKIKMQPNTLFNSAIEDVKKRKDSRSRSREKEIDIRNGERQFNNGNIRGGRFMRGGFGFPPRGGRGGRFIEPPMKRGGFIRGNIRGGMNTYPNNPVRNEDKNTTEINKQGDITNGNTIASTAITNDKPEINDQDPSKQQNKKKLRCKNWPHCKDTNCEYTHPTETCTFFPTCIYGTKCMNIHPNILCKYGFNCTRLGCNYSHPAGWNPGHRGMCQMPYPKKHFKKPNHNEQE